MNGFTLWDLMQIINDGIMIIYDENGTIIDVFTVGFTDTIEDLDGYGARIVNKFDRVTADNETHFIVILSDETDENERGQIPVYE